jgi:hypothetical protein
VGGHHTNGAPGLDFLDKLSQATGNAQAPDRESVRHACLWKATIMLFSRYKVAYEKKRKIMRNVASVAELKKSFFAGIDKVEAPEDLEKLRMKFWTARREFSRQCCLHLATGPSPHIAQNFTTLTTNASSSVTPNAKFREEILTFHDVPQFAGGIVPGDGIFTMWSYRAGAGRAEAFLLNAQPLTSRTAHEWGAVAEVVPNGKALPRARELANLYWKAPELTRRNTRVHFIQPLKERIVREVRYGLSLEGASAADLVKSMRAQNEPVAQKGKSA